MPLESLKRIIEGDLRETYEQLVINAPESEERDHMMGLMNVMCGNVDIECAYAVLTSKKTSNILGDELNIFEEIGKSYILLLT